VWHCANHRLELSVGDTVKTVSEINRFKSFIDKLHVLYHASPQNSRELHVCAKLLEVELLKIGRILSTRWVASRFRSVSAVWQNYEVSVRHFEEARIQGIKKEKFMYEGLQRKITSTQLILDFGLMCDSLQELSELTLDLQERNIVMYIASKKSKLLFKFLKNEEEYQVFIMKIQEKASTNVVFRGSHFTRQKAKMIQRLIPTLFIKI
jgi:hypothetical protein